MKAKCSRCRRVWHISIRARLPETGYLCPYCTKKVPRRAATHDAGQRENSRKTPFIV